MLNPTGGRPTRMSGSSRGRPEPPSALSSLRIDRWLWAARFFKTRSSAAAAVAGGKVHLNGQRTKPAKAVRAGDRLDVRRGDQRWEVTVLGTAARRGPASEARTLYEERPESVERREREREERRARRLAAAEPGGGRPTKRDRRRLDRHTTA